MLRLSYLFFLTILCNIVVAQNLVPNPSFEDTIPHNGFCQIPIEYATYWFNPSAGTPDLYTYSPGSANCTVSSLNNPNGYQLARTGINYAGFYTYPGTREYPAIKLDSSLSNGCVYYVEFYVSRANGYGLASDNIACAFTDDTTGYYLTSLALPLVPAVQSQPGILITDTADWVKISGLYTANGTEQFLLIGNFYDDANTYADTVSPSLYYSAYYYLDDVKVLSCDSTLAMGENLLEMEKENLSVYPNPTNDIINVFCNGNNKLDYAELYNQFGILNICQKLNGEKRCVISCTLLTNGSYFLKVRLKTGVMNYSKIIIIH